VALTRTEALRQVIEQLKEISAKVGPSRLVSGTRTTQVVNLSGVISTLEKLLAELVLQTTRLTSIDGKDFSTESTLSSLEGKDFATQTTLASIAGIDFANESGGNLDDILTRLTTLTNIDYFLSGDTTDGGDLLNELESVDQNWNLLSVNQLNLAAILAAVINNATSGRQDTAQTSFDSMVTDLTDAANRLSILIGKFEQKWSRTYTCTIAGSLVLTFTVPASDYWNKISFGFFPIIAANRIVSVVRGDAGGGRIIPLDGITTLTTLVNRMIPNTGASSARAPLDRWQGNATETYVLTISTPAIGDVIVIEMVADKLNATNMVTPAVAGTGTFTTGVEVRSVVTRF